MPKEAVFTVKLETELRDAFLAEAESVHQSASHLVREFMRDFVRAQQQAREHDAWFRAEVQKALNDPRPAIPHEQVMREARATIERIAARKRSA
jgi:predicted transcriptional regulator